MTKITKEEKMNPVLRRSSATLALVCIVLAANAWSQQTKTEVRRREVVNVSGNGVLLIEESAPIQIAAAAPVPQPEPARARLPETASDLPLIGLLGLWLVAIAVGLRAIRDLL